jgi:hypothetical protein
MNGYRRRRKEKEKTFLPQGSAQLIEKAHFRQGNPRKLGLFLRVLTAPNGDPCAGDGRRLSAKRHEMA